MRLKVLTAFAAVYLIWGSTFLAIRYAIETLPPFLMAGLRFLAAGALLYVWARLRGSPRPTRREWGVAAVAGTLMLVFGNGAVTWSEQRAPSGIVALLVATVPLWFALLDWKWGSGLRPGRRVAVGLVLGLGGVALLVGPSGLVAGEGVDPLAAGVVVLGSFSWAGGSLYSRRAPLPSSPMMATAAQMFAAGVIFVGVSAAFGEGFAVGAVTLRSGLALAYLIVFGSLIAFTAYVWLLGVASPARVSTYAYVNPVVAVFLGWAVADEPLNARTLLAAAVIIAGVVAITLPRPGYGRRAPRASGGVAVPGEPERGAA